MLIQRPIPKEGESWPGYLLRLAQKNHLNGITELSNVLNVTPRELLVSSPDSVLSKLKMKWKNDETLRGQKYYIKTTKKARSIHLVTYGRSMRTRVCAKCLVDSGSTKFPANWDRAFQFQCVEHQILLLEACPKCKSEITHERRCLESCDCGFSYAESPIQKIDFSLEAFYAACDLMDEYEFNAPTFSPYSQQELTVLMFLKRIFALIDGKTKGNGRYALSGDGFVTLEKMKQLNVLFENWPSNFNAFLHEQIRSLNKTPKQLIFQSPLNTSSKLMKIRVAVASASHLWRKKTVRKPRLTKPRKLIECEYVNRTYLMAETGCDKKTATFWIESGWLGSVSTEIGPNGVLKFKISKTAVQKAIHICKSTSSPTEMAMLIGLSELALRHLVRATVLTSIKYGKSVNNYRLEPKQVFELTRHIFDVAIHETEMSFEQLSFDEAIRFFGSQKPTVLKRLIDDIQAGGLAVYKTVKDAISLNQVSFEKAKFEAWHGNALIWNANP